MLLSVAQGSSTQASHSDSLPGGQRLGLSITTNREDGGDHPSRQSELRQVTTGSRRPLDHMVGLDMTTGRCRCCLEPCLVT
jgi:hypothetical protein